MFRFLSLATLTLLCPVTGTAQEYLDAFVPLSANDSPTKLVALLITDDDAIAWSELSSEDEAGGEATISLWCETSFRQTLKKVVAMRPDLEERLIVQRAAVGTPAILTRGEKRPWPPRAVVAVMDTNYRLLALAVGVPRARKMIGLIEDAEETRTILALHESNPKSLGESVAERAAERIDRAYGSVLRQELAEYDWEKTLAIADPSWAAQYGRVAAELDPVYRFDARLRFELSESGDPFRLRVLEQHIEPRGDWCDTIAPFVLGRPALKVLPPIIDSVWMETPVFSTSPSEHEELLRWFTTERENSLVVLAVKPPLLARQIPWPPPRVDDGKLSGRSWKALEAAMSKHAFRTVDAAELAVVLQSQDEQSIDLTLPSRVRYVFFENGVSRTFVIREGDLPAKFLRRF